MLLSLKIVRGMSDSSDVRLSRSNMHTHRSFFAVSGPKAERNVPQIRTFSRCLLFPTKHMFKQGNQQKHSLLPVLSISGSKSATLLCLIFSLCIQKVLISSALSSWTSVGQLIHLQHCDMIPLRRSLEPPEFSSPPIASALSSFELTAQVDLRTFGRVPTCA